MAPVKSRQHINTLAILEKQILGLKKASVSRRPKESSLRQGIPAKKVRMGKTKRAKSLNGATTLVKNVNKISKRDDKRLKGKKPKDKLSNDTQRKKTHRKGKSKNNNISDNIQKFPELLAQDSDFGFTGNPLTVFGADSEGHVPIDRLRKKQCPLNDWLPNHPDITKDMRREQVKLIITLAGKFIFDDDLAFHAVCILDNFMAATPERVVTSDNFQHVAVASFVVALMSRFGKQNNEIIDALAKVGYTEVQRIKRFTNFIQVTLGFECLSAPNALDFINAHYNNRTFGTPLNTKIEKVWIESKKLLMQASKSYTLMTQVYPSRLATAAILVYSDMVGEDCCKLFPSITSSISVHGIHDINVTMNWFRESLNRTYYLELHRMTHKRSSRQ